MVNIIEEKYRDRAARGADPSRVDQHLHRGANLAHSDCCSGHAFQTWVGQELAQGLVVLKETRRAREGHAAAQTARARAKVRAGRDGGGADG